MKPKIEILMDRDELMETISALMVYTDTIPEDKQLWYKKFIQRLFEDINKFEE